MLDEYCAKLRAVLIGSLLLAMMLAGCAPSEPGPLSFSDGNVGGPRSGQPAEFYLPSGSGPFPAVIVLHGCNGVSPHTREWAHRLANWGYAAFVIDSFQPRGISNVCNRGTVIPAALRARDVLAGVAYLRTLPRIEPNRLGAIGFSHGGWSVLFSARQALVGRSERHPLRAVVAYYPWCPAEAAPLAADVQIFIGDADDWTPVERCTDLASRYAATEAHRPTVRVYPGAVHAFDRPGGERVYLGHRIKHDPHATADAYAVTRRFLDERLSR